ncbi:MAG: DUF1501 domain-containing protein [Phycisphaeraceae bacterium]
MLAMNPFNFHYPCGITRRQSLAQMGNGFFGTAMAYMLAKDGLLGASPASAAEAAGPLASITAPRQPHFAPRAKACIFLYMVGGPSHIDTFDRKPKLTELHGKDYKVSASSAQSQKSGGKCKGSPFKFYQCGQTGNEISEIFPHLQKVGDELAILRGMHCDSAAHGAATLQMNTGYIRQGFPALGSWATYGLGSVNQNLPGFVVLVNGAPYSGAQNWSSAFMPAAFQGTVFRGGNEPVANIKPAGATSLNEQRQQLDLLSRLNNWHMEGDTSNSELSARVASYELAYRMQASAPEAVDLAQESEATQEMYGIGKGPGDRFGQSCLMARRLVERGVRFVEIFHSNWDTHGDNDNRHRKLTSEIDQPWAGLIQDLKQRGLLDSTMVVWAGEFGRTPFGDNGRDHHAAGFTTVLAGGGIKGGVTHGATDDIGFFAVDGKTHVHDLHATILHQMGLDHERLTYRYSGRDFRVTDVSGHVIREIIS